MKVALVTMVFPHPRQGVWPGIERHTGELAGALAREGAEVTVLTTFWNGGEEHETWKGIEILRVPDTGWKWGKAGRLLNAHVHSFGRNLLRHSDRLKRMDAIHSFVGLSRGKDLAALGVPLFSSFPHRDKPERLHDALGQYRDFRTERRFFPLASAVFAGSLEARRVLIDEYRLDPSRVHVVPLGVNGDVFTPPEKGRPGVPWDERPQGLRLLYIGPLIRRKGLYTLIEALPVVARSSIPFRLSMVGRGPEEASLRALAGRLGVADRIDFAGFVAEPELVRWYQNADIFIFPSTREGFGLVLVEAMACGLPIVVSDVAPMPEVVGGAGVLFAHSDPADLAAGILKVAKDPDLRMRLSREGRRLVEEKYLWRRVARQTLDHYERAISRAVAV